MRAVFRWIARTPPCQALAWCLATADVWVFRERCHCGRPVTYGYDGDPTHHRGMCQACDATRCDAYPMECPHRARAGSSEAPA